MKILELCLSPGLGGLELYMFRAAEALGGRHDVIAVLNNAGKLTEHFRTHSNVEPVLLKQSAAYLPVLNAFRLARVIDSREIDVMHVHWGKDLALAALAKMLSRSKPALVYTRQMKITRSKDDIYHRLLYGQMDRMLTITRQLEQDSKRFIQACADRITTLYYGVSAPERFLSEAEIIPQRQALGLQAGDFVVGLLGRLEHNKGQYLLIDALDLAARDNIDLKALIVGHEMKPGSRDELQRLAATKGLAGNVVFRDFSNAPQQLMQLCDCILLASHEETFGLVLPEAMRAGVAVIGSDRGGVPEIIDDRETGLLFESMDANSLFRAIQTLYADPELRRKLAIRGKEKADNVFNEDSHFVELERHLQNVAARNRDKQ